MQRRELTHIGVVFAVAIVARGLLFDVVGVWGDFGFYAYNSRLILEGQTPYIDFLGRSPLFIYSYTAVRAVANHVVTTLRAYVVLWWLVAGVPVYGIAREALDHQAGIVALAVYLLSPFALAYGFWANTQSLAAALAMIGLWVIVREDSTRAFAVAGVFLGAAFFSRRSVVVVLGGVGLFALWRLRHDLTLTAALRRQTAVVAGFVVTCGAGYLTLAGGDLATTWALAQTHGINLVASVGRGGYPLLGVEAPSVTNEIDSGRIPIFNDLCQMCGVWTARTFAKTLVVTVAPIGLLWVFLRDIGDELLIARDRQYLAGVFGVLGIYGIIVASVAGYPLRALAIVSFALFALGAYRAPRVSRQILYSREMGLLLFVLVGFTAGYLYRNRLLHTYYFMDFWPALSIVLAVAFVRLWRVANARSQQVVSVALIIGLVVAAGGAYPIVNIVVNDNAGQWFTTDSLEDYGADINARTDPGDVVFTATPTYLTGTQARMVDDNARLHYVFATFGEYAPDGPAGDLYRSLIPQLRDGTIKYAIVDDLTRNILRGNETARSVFSERYCRVDSAEAQELYNRTDATLYEYRPDSCPERPTIEPLR